MVVGWNGLDFPLKSEFRGCYCLEYRGEIRVELSSGTAMRSISDIIGGETTVHREDEGKQSRRPLELAHETVRQTNAVLAYIGRRCWFYVTSHKGWQCLI